MITLLPVTVAEDDAGVLMLRPSKSPKLLVLVSVLLSIVAELSLRAIAPLPVELLTVAPDKVSLEASRASIRWL
ncbi:hypothetical protein [Pseudomonas fluorescens]|uniref:hypothetical protein n=1 Tax=Pseudomonas fluorescens TaxID=294 RepID=UPI001F07AA84|nr:hypothetical protein [Pseudomonas fluorescens]